MRTAQQPWSIGLQERNRGGGITDMSAPKIIKTAESSRANIQSRFMHGHIVLRSMAATMSEQMWHGVHPMTAWRQGTHLRLIDNGVDHRSCQLLHRLRHRRGPRWQWALGAERRCQHRDAAVFRRRCSVLHKSRRPTGLRLLLCVSAGSCSAVTARSKLRLMCSGQVIVWLCRSFVLRISSAP